jgi:hypothetical protein
VVVVHPTFVAFIPTGPRTYLAAIAAKAVFAAATGAISFRVGGRVLSPAELIAYLRSLGDADLLWTVRELAAQRDGVVWSPDEAKYGETILPLGVRLSFLTPNDRVMLLDAKRVWNDPAYRAIVSAWPRIPTKPPKPIAAILATIAGLVLALAGLATSLFTLIVVAAAVSDGTAAGRHTSIFFCCVDLVFLAPAAALLAFGLRRLARRGGRTGTAARA